MGIPGLLWLGARRTGHGALERARGARRGDRGRDDAARLLTRCGARRRDRGGGLVRGRAAAPARRRRAPAWRVGWRGDRVLGLGQHGLSDRVELAVRESAGYELGLAVAVVLLVVLVASQRRLALPTSPSIATRWSALRSSSRWRSRPSAWPRWRFLDEFRRIDLPRLADADRSLGIPPPNDPGRLTAAGSVRARYWNEALKAFRDNTWRGVGAGGYATVRPRYRQDEIGRPAAHGYVMRFAADLDPRAGRVAGTAGGVARLRAARNGAPARLPRPPVHARARRPPHAPGDRRDVQGALAHRLHVVRAGNALPALVAAGFLAGRARFRTGAPRPLKERT